MMLKNKNLLTLLFFGLIIRLALAQLPGFRVDVTAWYAWALRLNDLGFANFYSSQIWTNYTPGYLYVLYILGFIRNIFNLNPNAFYYLLKIPAILTDLTLTALIFLEVRKHFSEKISLIIAGFFLISPAVLFDSSVWGQIDSILTLFMFLSVWYLIKEKIFYSALFFALAFLIKPQALALTPIFLFYFLRNFKFRKIAQFAGVTLGTFLFLFIPFVFKTSATNIPQLILNMASDYSYTSLFAFNFWGGVGFWLTDSQKISFFTYQQFGILLYLIYWVIVFAVALRKNLSLYSIAALATLSFYYLPTRIHERYLFPALPFLILLIPQLKQKIFMTLSMALSLLYFINLYYVYVYYNFYFYHVSSPIYWFSGYDLISNNAKLLSVLGTIIFGAISSLILLQKKHEEA